MKGVTEKYSIKRDLNLPKIWNIMKSLGNMNVDNRTKDYGAHPVFSAWSEIGGFDRNKSLPEIIHVEYKPITITSSMNDIEVQDALVT